MRHSQHANKLSCCWYLGSLLRSVEVVAITEFGSAVGLKTGIHKASRAQIREDVIRVRYRQYVTVKVSELGLIKQKTGRDMEAVHGKTGEGGPYSEVRLSFQEGCRLSIHFSGHSF